MARGGPPFSVATLLSRVPNMLEGGNIFFSGPEHDFIESSHGIILYFSQVHFPQIANMVEGGEMVLYLLRFLSFSIERGAILLWYRFISQVPITEEERGYPYFQVL